MSRKEWDDATLAGTRSDAVLPPWLARQDGPRGTVGQALAGQISAATGGTARPSKLEALEPLASRQATSPQRSALAPSTPSLHLLWFDAARIVQAKRCVTPDDDDDGWVDDRAIGPDAPADAARELLVGAPSSLGELEAIVRRSEDARGFVQHAFAVVSGDLAPRFDRARRLTAIVELVEPLGALDKRVADTCREAKELAARRSAPQEALRAMQRRVLDAYAAHGRPAAEVEETADALLLEARAFDQRSVVGRETSKASLTEGRVATAAYLPGELAERLPLLKSVRVRLVVEIVPFQESNEGAWAVVPVAAARELSRSS